MTGDAARAPSRLRLRLLGIGAMNSPWFAPAGLLVCGPAGDVMLDGGPGAEPGPAVAAWLVTDLQAELVSALRRLARDRGVQPEVAAHRYGDLVIEPQAVVHTSHPTWGYLLRWHGRSAVWAPEFWTFPEWAAGADLVFADAAGWQRPIRFRGGVGGHAPACETSEQARRQGVRRLVFAHLGRPTVRALHAGRQPLFGEIGEQGKTYLL